MKISKIILYDEPTVPEIQLERLGEFLKETFPVKVEIRDSFIQEVDAKILDKISNTQIFDLKKPFDKQPQTEKEIQFKQENQDMSSKEELILYDGFKIQNEFAEAIPAIENNENTFHVIFTNKLLCTFEEDGFRYHARALIGSNPTIISTTGMIEAPAKPKQYYLDVMTNFPQEKADNIKEKYGGMFLEYKDVRLADIAEGYLLQAITYYETGEEFCKDKNCRLFNAHWQEDLLSTQVENKKLCKTHFKILKRLREQSSP